MQFSPIKFRHIDLFHKKIVTQCKISMCTAYICSTSFISYVCIVHYVHGKFLKAKRALLHVSLVCSLIIIFSNFDWFLFLCVCVWQSHVEIAFRFENNFFFFYRTNSLVWLLLVILCIVAGIYVPLISLHSSIIFWRWVYFDVVRNIMHAKGDLISLWHFFILYFWDVCPRLNSIHVRNVYVMEVVIF